jgi:hypothetical protein
MPDYWQIAAGGEGRNYAAYFLKYGIAFADDERVSKLPVGDRLLLKRGTSALVAVGEVVERNGRVHGHARRDADSSRQWLLDFDGWGLSSWCHVRWHKLADDRPVNGLLRGTITRSHDPHLQSLAEQMLRELPPLEQEANEPRSTKHIEDSDLLRHLVKRGLRAGAAEELTRQLGRIRLLAHYYRGLDWSSIKEHETRTFLVVPLLLALGWAEQQLKIELRCASGSVDIACFRDPYSSSSPNQCVMLIETKGLSQGLDLVFDQAERYARDFPTCNLLLVTNGVYYRAYTRMDEQIFRATPVAHLNLIKPTDLYPLDSSVPGALEAIELLLPNVAARHGLGTSAPGSASA